MKEEQTMSQQFRTIGRRMRRPDAGPRVTGHERYADDLLLPGMLHACLVLSDQASATIEQIVTSEAASQPGVRHVLTAADLPEFARVDDPADRTRFFLAERRISYVGQPVAAVIAETAAGAAHAADLVRVTYQPGPATIFARQALADGANVVRPGAGGVANLGKSIRFARADVEAAFHEAAVTVERTFTTHSVHQSYMEPRSVVAAVDFGGKLTIWTGTQGQFVVRTEVARALGLPETQVRVEPVTLGGGFGARFVIFEPLAGLLAQVTGRPVKLTLTRAQDFTGGTPAPESVLHVALAADAGGNFTGLRADLTFNTGFFAKSPFDLASMMLGSAYRYGSLEIESREVFSNRSGTGAYRAPGLPQVFFALETLVDEVASRLGIDRLAIRRQNVVREGDPMADGGRWRPFDFGPVFDEIERSPIWTSPNRPDEGVGVAIGIRRGATEPASASITLNADGTFQVIVGSMDITGTNTGITQIVAETLDVPTDLVNVTSAPTESAPYAGRSGGSKILYTVGNAAIQAAEDVRRQLLAIAADALEAGIDDLEIADDRVRVRGSDEFFVTFAQIQERSLQGANGHGPVFGYGNQANPEPAPAITAQVARVRVDPETGRTTLTDFLAVQDVGRAINPGEVEGQIHGGVVQGIGWGLYEALVYDDSGQLLTGSLMDYALPKADDVPSIEVRLLENPSPHGPFGARGVGESPIIAPAAAIANAITDATGVRLTELPMTSQRIWQAIRDQRDRE
jgi:CO/xanthine dehydrogenase Mo-binding subunit